MKEARTRRPKQTSFTFPTWGGKREGAGRKRSKHRTGVPHRPRPRVTKHTPVHITLKVREDIWNLRGRSISQIVLACIGQANDRLDVRLVQFSVQTDHIHMILEAEDDTSLARAMKGLCVRLAHAINRRMRRRGSVFADRYHVHVLRSPTEVRNAIRYVAENRRVHAAREGWQPKNPGIDPLAGGPCSNRFPPATRALVATPRSWLLRTAWNLPPLGVAGENPDPSISGDNEQRRAA